LHVYLLLLSVFSSAAAVFLGVAGLLQRRRGRTFAALGMAIGVPGLALCCALLVALPTALDTSIADPGAPVGGPKPPKEVPRPPESSLSFRSRSVSAAPTFWRKIVRATMFCRREEGLPLPPKHEALEARAGSTLVFEFRGEEALEGERGGPGPGHAPPLRGRREDRRGGGDATRPRRRPVRRTRAVPRASPAGDRFLVEATLSPGEYAVRLVARLEVTRRAPTPSVLPLPFPLDCR
jgi:hypothetical protein